MSRPCAVWTVCTVFLALLSVLHARAVATARLPLTPRLLHQFPDGTWVENIATLPSGLLLVTLLNNAKLMLIDPRHPAGDPITVYHAISHTALLGIAQPSTHTIAVVYGNLTGSEQIATPGSFGIALFTLRSNGTVSPTLSVPVPHAHMLDGLTAFPYSSRYLLAADSVLGLIWRVDLSKGIAKKAFTSPLLQPRRNTTQAAVNGIHVEDKFLYFTNSNTATFGRIEITDEGLPVHGSTTTGEILVTDYIDATYDDFALGQSGRDEFFLCSPTGFSINRFSLRKGKQQIYVGGSVDKGFNHPIAAMLGKSKEDYNTLYITTAGTITGIEGIKGGGQLFAVDVIA